MSIHYDTKTLREIIESHKNRGLVLPNFQRGFVWTLDDQKQLLTSLLADIPIGSVLLLRGEKDDFASRPFGQRSEANPISDCTFLLDGQQRLSCVYYFLSDPLRAVPEWNNTVDDTYWSLRYRWFVRVVPLEDKPDPFGFLNLQFQGVREEPDVLADFVSHFRVNKTGPYEDPAHPKWLEQHCGVEDSDRGELRHEMASSFADEGLVPLWEVSDRPSDPESLHGRTVQAIANRRGEFLRARSGPADQAILANARIARPELRLAPGQVNREDLREAIRTMSAAWVQRVTDYFDSLGDQEVPQVVLPRDEINRAIPIFEVMNQGGTPLTTFDLVVAKMGRANRANQQMNLADQLIERAQTRSIDVSLVLRRDNDTARLVEWRPCDYDFVVEPGRNSLTKHFKNALLNLMSIKHNSRTSLLDLDVDCIKRPAILKLKPRTIAELWSGAANSIVRAWCFLNLRCGVRKGADLRNKLILLPIAFALAEDEIWRDRIQLDRIEYWYWCTTLGGAYTGRQNANCIEDIKQLAGWLLRGEMNPYSARESGVLTAAKYSDRETLLRKGEEYGIRSDVGQYLPQYVLSHSPRDFVADVSLTAWESEQELELHHVIPLRDATSVGESTRKLRRQSEKRNVLNSPLNQTFVLKSSNRALGTRPIQQYIRDMPIEARVQHYFPSDVDIYERQLGERDKQLYRRILERRYDALVDAIHRELSSLRHS